MRRAGRNARGSVREQRLAALHQSSRGIYQIVHHQTIAALHLADHVHHLGHVGFFAALVDDGQRRIQPFGEGPRALHTARVGRNHREIRDLQRLEIVDHHRRPEQVVHRDIEKSLNLRRMQIERQHTVRSRSFYQPCNQFC